MIAQTVVPVLRRWDPARKLPSRAPILVVVGADDNLFCTGVTVYNCASPASVRAFESQFYSPAAHLKLVTIPDTSHALALSATAPITDAVMIGWSLATVAP
jgi:hypothetical protein